MSLRPSDIPKQVVRELEAGTRQTSNLAEALAIDCARLAHNALPDLPAEAIERLRAAAPLGITRRMALAAELALQTYAKRTFELLAEHPSDTVRGWACYALGLQDRLSIEQRLRRIRPLADDPHFGVREWAWLGLRQRIAADPQGAIELLTPWTAVRSERLRRFACEATRPRGVWAMHIAELKSEPDLALQLLEPLRNDPSKYVQDSVANWLNDAAKSKPDWVRSVVDRWMSMPDATPATARIAHRALRSLKETL